MEKEGEWLSIQVDQQEVDRVKLESDAGRDFLLPDGVLKTEKEPMRWTVYGKTIEPTQRDLLEQGKLGLKLCNQTTSW